MKKIFRKFAGLDIAENEEIEDNEEEMEEFEPRDHEEEVEEEDDGEWPDNEFEEGQLSIDVYQTPDSIVVKSTIAGVKPGDIDISINNDMLTIRGKREHIETIRENDYLFRECYWGSFSRSVILPVEIEADKIDAELEIGVLTITLPKAKSSKQINIKVKGK